MSIDRILTLGAFCFFTTIAVGQEQLRVEYFFDSDPGHGQAASLTASTGKNTLSFDASTLKPGAHQLCFRVQDGNGAWSPTMARTFYVYKTTPTEAIAMEYVLDTDPGHGKGTMIQTKNGENSLTLDLGNVETGAHQLYLRAQDNAGNWTHIMARTFYVCENHSFKSLEYYFDNSDPGQGKGTAIEIPTKWNETFSFDVDISGLTTGNHYINVRGQDHNGNWSVVSREPFTIHNDGSGVVSLTANMDMDIKARDGIITVSGVADGKRGDCLVEVFGLGGETIAAAEWSAASSQIVLNATGTAMIIKVTDRTNGKQLVRRIIMR